MAEKKIKILLADDELEFIRPILFWLKSIGYEASFVQSGKEVLQRIKSSAPPDILLMDINMPVMSGIETLEKIRDFNKELPIILLTTETYREAEGKYAKARRLGISGFFLKSSTFDQLVDMLETTIKIYRQYRPYE